MLPSCYRHPDRETRLACSNCGRPVCVECVRTADVGQRCLECAAPAPGAQALDMDDVRRQGSRPPVVTYAVLAVSVAIFLVELLVPSMGFTIRVNLAQINEAVTAGEWWRLLTAAFLHGGMTHIAFNMYALYLFGPQLEREVGSVPFAAMYVAAALSGGAAFYFAQPQGIAVGASGAIFGLFGAWLAASYRGRHTTTGRASLRQLLVLLGINAALGFVPGANIAWEAHAGGLVAGLVIAGIWMLPPLRRQAALRTLVAAVVAAAALLTVL
jgi:membrane associated rhomboid family serine protease